MKHYMTFILSYIILFFPSLVLANGASYHFGIKGSEITVDNVSKKKFLDVTETVVIDAKKDTVSVEYKIKNNGPDLVQLNMVFPVQNIGGDCEYTKEVFADDMKSTILKTLNLEVSLNENDVKIAEIDSSVIALSEDYEALKKEACVFAKFDVSLKPGENSLRINHAIFDSGGDSSGQVLNYYYVYSIWPAKNWVSKFNKATWRIYPPSYVESIGPLNLSDKWVVKYDYPYNYYYQYKIDIKAPGQMSNHGDYVEFSSEDYQPSGNITVSVKINEITSLLEGCKEENVNNCWRSSLEKVLFLRPYEGDKRIYIEPDLALVLVSDYMGGHWKFYAEALPYIRNEIFARKGYVFKSDKYNEYFNKMPWYKPKYENIELNEIEMKNIEFIKGFENGISDKRLIDMFFK